MPIQQLAEFIGNVVAAEPGVDYAVLYFKGLEIERNKALRQSRGHYETMITLSDESRDDIQWWLDNLPNAVKIIQNSLPDFVTVSDASMVGWGAVFQGSSTGGDWSAEEAEHHINWLELQAAFFTFQIYCVDFRDAHVRMMIDNTTAVACINKMGSTRVIARIQ